MMRILIVDDEPIIRNGLARTVREQNLFDQVDTAKNGLEALELCKDNRYHVILLDIMMPDMNGIEFLEQLRKRELLFEQENDVPIQTLKIVLSGYDEFDFAQKAITLGVHEFLLKPLDPDDVVQLTNKLYQRAVSIEENMQRRMHLRDQIQQSLPLLYEKFFNDLVGSELSEEEILNKSRFLGLSLDGEFFLAAVAAVLSSGNNSELVGSLGMNSLKTALQNFPLSGFHWHLFEIGLSKCAIVFYFDSKPDADLQIEAYLSELIAGIREKEGYHIHCGIGRMVSDLTQIKDSYRDANKALMYTTLLTDSAVQKLSDEEDSTGQIFVVEDLSELSGYLKLGNLKKCEKFLNRMFSQIEKQQNPQVAVDIRIMFSGILYTCLSSMRQKNVQFDEGRVNTYYKAIQGDNKLHTIEEYKNMIMTLLQDTIALIRKESSSKSLSLIEKAKKIVEENSRDDLTTHGVAEYLGLSRNYFGQLFKKETGCTFSDYVNRVRISKAKKLLQTTTLKVYEISELVGIEDSFYFSSLFKKYVGCSPTEYREA
ncbi:MAG: response regulator [Caldicoprobacterales bacterium]|jgi:two-component system response regulator YesN|nr:response regulator [Clostridiales bacterium]